jgi:hypothetical protein
VHGVRAAIGFDLLSQRVFQDVDQAEQIGEHVGEFLA